MTISVVLFDETNNTMITSKDKNDHEVINLFKSSLSNAVEICQPTSLPINLRRCGCPLVKDPQNTCRAYSLYEIIGIFEPTRRFACGKHLRQVLKSSFTFPGLTIVYQGRFRSEINTPMSYNYPSHDVFVERMQDFIKNKGLSVPSFDISDIFRSLLPHGKYLTDETTKCVLLKKVAYEDVNNYKDEICCICHETMDCDTSGCLKKCNHRFHVHCLQKLVDSKNYVCPLCRTVIRTEYIDNKFM